MGRAGPVAFRSGCDDVIGKRSFKDASATLPLRTLAKSGEKTPRRPCLLWTAHALQGAFHLIAVGPRALAAPVAVIRAFAGPGLAEPSNDQLARDLTLEVVALMCSKGDRVCQLQA